MPSLDTGGQAVPQRKDPSNLSVYAFIVTLSFTCALVLSILASALKKPQEIARELDRSKQMLLAARIYHEKGYFQIYKDGKYLPSKHDTKGLLVPGTVKDIADNYDILKVYRKRFRPILVDAQGQRTSFQEVNIDENEYLLSHQKDGYARLPYKLVYEILPNSDIQQPEGYIIPINGFGVWDAIYGYLAIAPDGNTVIGISWYDHKETPGLGAIISEPSWQALFYNKHLFQGEITKDTNLERVPIGISIVRGKVAEVLGDSPKALSAVDGIPGATLTGNGVSQAIKEVLNEYRPFLISLNKESSS